VKTSQWIRTSRNYFKLLDSMSLVTKDLKGYECVSNINKVYLEDRAVPEVTCNTIIYLNPDTNTDGDTEHEISDTKDRSASSSEDLCLEFAQSVSK